MGARVASEKRVRCCARDERQKGKGKAVILRFAQDDGDGAIYYDGLLF